MSDDITKKLVAAGTAAVAVFIFGEAQILDMEERIVALEEVCSPAEEELEESAEDPQSEDEEAEEPAEEEEPEEEGEPEEE